MTLDELYQRCVDDPSLIPGYIKSYKKIRVSQSDALSSIQFKDLGIKDEYTNDLPSRTKGVVIGLIRQALISNNQKLKTIDLIISELEYIQEAGYARPKAEAPAMDN